MTYWMSKSPNRGLGQSLRQRQVSNQQSITDFETDTETLPARGEAHVGVGIRLIGSVRIIRVLVFPILGKSPIWNLLLIRFGSV